MDIQWKQAKRNCELNILNFKGETDANYIGILLSKYNFDKYQSDDKDVVEISFNDSFEVEASINKRDSIFWVRDLINTLLLIDLQNISLNKLNYLHLIKI